MKLLFATTVLPFARAGGGEVASDEFIEALRAAGHRVVVVGYQRPGTDRVVGQDAVAVAERPIETSEAAVRGGAWLLAALLSGSPYSVAKYRSRRYRAAIRKAIAGLGPDAVIVDHAQMAWLLEALPEGLPAVLLAHNAEHRLYRDAAGRSRRGVGWINRREARLIEKLERSGSARVDRIWALSAADAELFSRFGSATLLEPPVVLPPDPGPAPIRDVGLLGSWTWEANAAGLEWFVGRVLPLLPPRLSVTIAGAGGERWRERGAVRPRFEGRVADGPAFLSASRVIAVPSVAGEGVQVKTLDAIASGRPVVATPIAVRGIEDPPATVSVASEPAAFAAMLAERASAPPAPGDRAAALAWAQRRRDRFRARLEEELAALAGAELR